MSPIFSSAPPPAYTETSSMEHATMAQRADKEFVMRRVAQNGRELQYASEELRDDKEVVMAAVANDGVLALNHASDRLIDDKELREITHSAMKDKHPTFPLLYASDALCGPYRQQSASDKSEDDHEE